MLNPHNIIHMACGSKVGWLVLHLGKPNFEWNMIIYSMRLQLRLRACSWILMKPDDIESERKTHNCTVISVNKALRRNTLEAFKLSETCLFGFWVMHSVKFKLRFQGIKWFKTTVYSSQQSHPSEKWNHGLSFSNIHFGLQDEVTSCLHVV